jgi:hypothetical protein
MIIFALGCLAGFAGTMSALCLGEGRPHLAMIFAGNAIVAAAASIGWAVGVLP